MAIAMPCGKYIHTVGGYGQGTGVHCEKKLCVCVHVCVHARIWGKLAEKSLSRQTSTIWSDIRNYYYYINAVAAVLRNMLF